MNTVDKIVIIIGGILLGFILGLGIARADTYTIEASDGKANMRDGPGVNHALVGAIPNHTVVNSSKCVARDDSQIGAPWCLVTYAGRTGWISQALLMPVIPTVPEQPQPKFGQQPQPHDQVLFSGGNWMTYRTMANTNKIVCGMMSGGANGQLFDIKNLGDGVYVQLFNPNWRNFSTDLNVKLGIGFDNNNEEYVTVDANITKNQPGKPPIVDFSVSGTPEQRADFMDTLANSRQMWIRFKTGTERPWRIDLRGGRGAVSAWNQCLTTLSPDDKNDDTSTTPAGAKEESF